MRTLCMLMIVVWHFYFHGIMHGLSGKTIYADGTALGIFNYVLSTYLSVLCSVCVNGYVLISGYFLVNKTFKLERVIKLWMQTFFYALIITVVVHFIFPEMAGIKDILKTFTPIRSREYWFVTIYMGMMLLSPFLAQAAHALTQPQYKILLLVLGILNITFFFNLPYGDIYGGGMSLLWFIFLFLVAGYIRLYDVHLGKEKYGHYFWYISFFIFGFVVFRAILSALHHHEGLGYSSSSYNGFSFFLTIALFMYFKNHTFGDAVLVRFLVKIAPYTFGVYLIHDNNFIRTILWYKNINFDNYLGSIYLLPIMLVVSICIFVICIFIDFFRDQLFHYCRIDNLIADFSSVIGQGCNTVKKWCNRE
nr:acyltransferase [Prevotella sp.]